MTTTTNKTTRTFLAFLIGAPLACAEPTDLDDADEDLMTLADDSDGEDAYDDDARAEEGLRPFHVAGFDHEPTEEEIQAELRQFLGSDEGNALFEAIEDQGDVSRLLPTGWVYPAPGQKLVRLDATTSNITDAGTDEANLIKFYGTWYANDGHLYTEAFILDNPSHDDLNRNTTDVFYYLLNFNNYAYNGTSDRFIRGRIGTSSTDGWHCQQINLTDQNHAGQQRLQVLPFNQWVDYPSPRYSPWIYGNNTTQWLSYY